VCVTERDNRKKINLTFFFFVSKTKTGGSFTTAGGAAANKAARFLGTTWTAINIGVASDQVYAIAVLNSTSVYFGGNFASNFF